MKDQLEKDLQNRINKVLQLELELDQVKEECRHIERSIPSDDLSFKHKVQTLKMNYEQIHDRYLNVC